jgi:hypothetical protein
MGPLRTGALQGVHKQLVATVTNIRFRAGLRKSDWNGSKVKVPAMQLPPQFALCAAQSIQKAARLAGHERIFFEGTSLIRTVMRGADAAAHFRKAIGCDPILPRHLSYSGLAARRPSRNLLGA